VHRIQAAEEKRPDLVLGQDLPVDEDAGGTPGAWARASVSALGGLKTQIEVFIPPSI